MSWGRSKGGGGVGVVGALGGWVRIGADTACVRELARWLCAGNPAIVPETDFKLSRDGTMLMLTWLWEARWILLLLLVGSVLVSLGRGHEGLGLTSKRGRSASVPRRAIVHLGWNRGRIIRVFSLLIRTIIRHVAPRLTVKAVGYGAVKKVHCAIFF